MLSAGAHLQYRKPTPDGTFIETHKQKGAHTCEQSVMPAFEMPIVDARTDMHKLAETKALKEVFKTASEIANEVLVETRQEHEGGAVRLLNIEQLKKIV